MDDVVRFRMRILGVVAVSLFAALFGRLYFLQILNQEAAAEEAQTNVLREIVIPAPRGRILDVDGRVLVDNRLTTIVSINQQALADARLSADERRAMLLGLALELNRSGSLVKVADIEAQLDDPSFGRFDDVPIAYDVDDELLIYIGERGDRFPGVSVRQGTVRSYPFGSLAAHLLGWVGPINSTELASRTPPEGKAYGRRDEVGKAGIELMFEDDLRGQPGRRVVEVDNTERIIRERSDLYRPPEPGSDVVLTIDIDIQALVEEELLAALQQAREQIPDEGEPDFDAPAGSAVVLDPSNGDLIAMASYPTYDPNESIGGFSAERWAALNDPVNHLPMFNRAIQGEYAPGSTFKLFSALGAWREDVFGFTVPFGQQGINFPEWDQPIDDPGVYRMRSCIFAETEQEQSEAGGCFFQNAGRIPHEAVDLARSLTVSSDFYYYWLGEATFVNEEISDTTIQDEATRFGLGEETGVALPFEQNGRMPTPASFAEQYAENPEIYARSEWSPGDSVITAIGQGDVLVTPLQLANAYATFAADGVRHAPNVAVAVRTADGEVVREFGPRVIQEIPIDAQAREALLEGLVGVVAHPEGTAYEAFNDPAAGGVSFPHGIFPVAAKTGTAEVDDQADTSLFAAFGPVDAPRYAVAAVLEESGFGSRNAAPLVARILQPIGLGTVEEAKPAELRYAEFVAGPLCVDWLIDVALPANSGTPSSTTVDDSSPAPTTEVIDPELAGPMVNALGEIDVRGVLLDCTDFTHLVPAELEARESGS